MENPVDVGGRQTFRTISVDCRGESSRNCAGHRLETLLVGPVVRGSVREKFGGRTLPRVDRLDLTDETRPRWEIAVTLPDPAHPTLISSDDTPVTRPPDRSSHGDDVRPWDGWDDDERDVAS